MRTGGSQRLDRRGATVPHDDGVTGGEQIAGDGLAHVTQADESDVHDGNSLRSASAEVCTARVGGGRNAAFPVRDGRPRQRPVTGVC